MKLSEERAKEILKKYKKDKALFNWCEEYKDFISKCVNGCFSVEVDYILKKSTEDTDAPFSYEDLDLFDIDKAREHALYNFEDNSKECKIFANNKETFNRKVKTKGDFEVFLKSLNKEELNDLFNELDLDICEADGEVLEWWFISDPLKYRLEKQDEIFLNETYWGRQTSGQSISLDYCCIEAFINIVKDRLQK